MDTSAAARLVVRSAQSRLTRLNIEAMAAQEGARSGTLHDIAKYSVLADQAWEAQRAVYGLRWIDDECGDGSMGQSGQAQSRSQDASGA